MRQILGDKSECQDKMKIKNDKIAFTVLFLISKDSNDKPLKPTIRTAPMIECCISRDIYGPPITRSHQKITQPDWLCPTTAHVYFRS